MVDEVKLSFLNAGDMAGGMREEGVDDILPGLII